MPSYNLSVLGLEVSFKAEEGPERVYSAKRLVEGRLEKLVDGKTISKEKLLVYLALGLADELLQSMQKQSDMEAKVAELVAKIDGAA